MNSQDPIQKLRSMTMVEINQLEAGIYSDFDIAFVMGSGEKDGEIDHQKQFALLTLILRSAETDDYFDYSEMLFDMLHDLASTNQGENLLYWTLFAITYYAKNAPDLMDDVEYYFYCRGLLYEGHYESFLKVLRLMLDQEPLSKPNFKDLIDDFNRLNQVALVQKLDQVGQKKFGKDWDLNLENPSTEGDAVNIPDSIQNEIVNILNEDCVVLEDDFTDFNGLFSYQDVLDQIKSNEPGKSYLPMVPDMIKALFAQWDEDRQISYDILKILKEMSNNPLPELTFLGELLEFDSKTVYVSKTFGKTQGFSLESLKHILLESRFSTDYRGYAGRMLMDVAQNNPDVRMEIVDLLNNIIANPPADTLAYEMLVTFLVADVLDFDLYELKGAIVKAFNENRVSPMVVGTESFNANWSLHGIKDIQKDHENIILLKCKSCQRTRKYPYDYLLMDLDHFEKRIDSATNSLFINRKVRCNKCGEVDNYEIEDSSLLGILPVRIIEDNNSPFAKHNDNLFFVTSKVMHDLGYKEISFDIVRQTVISGKTQDIEPLLLGEYYRTIGWFEEALGTFQMAHKEQPEDRDELLMLACSEHDFGDKEKAKTYYQQVLSLAKGDVYLSISNPTSQNALNGLARLKEGKSSPLPYPKNLNGQDLLAYKQTIKKQKRHRH